MFLPMMPALLSRKKPAIFSVLERPHLHLGEWGERKQAEALIKSRQSLAALWNRLMRISQHVFTTCCSLMLPSGDVGARRMAASRARAMDLSSHEGLCPVPAPSTLLFFGVEWSLPTHCEHTWTKALLLTQSIAIARLVPVININCSSDHTQPRDGPARQPVSCLLRWDLTELERGAHSMHVCLWGACPIMGFPGAWSPAHFQWAAFKEQPGCSSMLRQHEPPLPYPELPKLGHCRIVEVRRDW